MCTDLLNSRVLDSSFVNELLTFFFVEREDVVNVYLRLKIR